MFETVFCFIGIFAVCGLIAYFFYRGFADLRLGVRLFIACTVFFTLYFLFMIVGYELGSI